GLVGAYFRVDGAISEPEVEPLPLATFLTAVPSAIKAPLKVLQYLFNRDDDRDRRERRGDERGDDERGGDRNEARPDSRDPLQTDAGDETSDESRSPTP